MMCDYCQTCYAVCDSDVPHCSSCDFTCYLYSCVCHGPCYGYGPISRYRVQIDSTGNPDTIKWSDDGGLNWKKTNVPIQTGWMTLNNGVKIKFDNPAGHTLTDYWDFYCGDGVYAGERLIWYHKNYSGGTLNLINHLFYPGKADQDVCQSLKNEVNEWNAPLVFTAYSMFSLTYNQDAFRGSPDFNVVLKGRKLYDPRDASTIFSRNPALVWLDILTSKRYGFGAPMEIVDLQSVKDAANWLDANDFHFDGAIIDRQAFMDNLEAIMLNFRAFTVWADGKYYLKILTDDAPVKKITDDDVDVDPDSFVINVQGTMETINKAILTFADKESNYTATPAVWEDLTRISLDGEPKTLEKALIGTNNMTQGRRIAKYAVMRNKFNKEFTFPCHPRLGNLEPGDMVSATLSYPGWVDKRLRVKDLSYPIKGTIPITFMDEDSSIYDMTL